MSEFASIHKRWTQIADTATTVSPSVGPAKGPAKTNVNVGSASPAIRTNNTLRDTNKSKATNLASRMKLDIDEEDESFDGSQVLGIISPRGMVTGAGKSTTNENHVAKQPNSANNESNNNHKNNSAGVATNNTNSNTISKVLPKDATPTITQGGSNDSAISSVSTAGSHVPSSVASVMSPRNLNFNAMGQQNVASAKYAPMFGSTANKMSSITSPRNHENSKSQRDQVHAASHPPLSPTSLNSIPADLAKHVGSTLGQQAAASPIPVSSTPATLVARNSSDLFADLDDILINQPRREDRPVSTEEKDSCGNEREDSIEASLTHKSRSDMSGNIGMLHQPNMSAFASNQPADDCNAALSANRGIDSRQGSLAYGTPSRPCKRLSVTSDHETPSSSLRGSHFGSPRHSETGNFGDSGRPKVPPPNRAHSTGVQLIRGTSTESSTQDSFPQRSVSHATEGPASAALPHKQPHSGFQDIVVSPRLVSMQSNVVKDSSSVSQSGRFGLMHGTSPDPMEPVNDTDSEDDQEKSTDRNVASKTRVEAVGMESNISLADILEPDHHEDGTSEPASRSHRNLKQIMSGRLAISSTGNRHPSAGSGPPPTQEKDRQNRVSAKLGVKSPRQLKTERSKASNSSHQVSTHGGNALKVSQHGGTAAMEMGAFETAQEEEGSGDQTTSSPTRVSPQAQKTSGRLSGRLRGLTSLSSAGNESASVATPSPAAATSTPAESSGSDKKRNAIKKFLGMSAKR